MEITRVSVVHSERVFPEHPPATPCAVPLSLLDATTADFALTNALWCFTRPKKAPESDAAFKEHLRKALRIVLDAYPHWSGRLKAISTIDGVVPDEAQHFPPHARRFGRVYTHFGTPEDPGVEFRIATSQLSLEDVHSASRPESHPLWDRDSRTDSLREFIPFVAVRRPFMTGSEDQPVLAIQITLLSDSSFVVAAKISHPLADITSLVRFVQDWAAVSRSLLESQAPPVLKPYFDPSKLDSQAAGDINANEPDSQIINHTMSLPMHRFDWWIPSPNAPSWGSSPPDVFNGEELLPAGNPMPWDEWDDNAPISSYVVHLSRNQVEFLYSKATEGSSPTGPRISKHDVILAHIWSCIMRARQQQDDGPVHCNLSCGSRPVLKLGSDFVGSPVVMANLELPASTVSAASNLGMISQQIRKTLARFLTHDNLVAHFHSLAFEKSPQRIWQGFMGRRHLITTTWTRAGLYEVDFGFGSDIRFADGIVPPMDGNVLIKEAPPPPGRTVSPSSWTEYGVDVNIHIRDEDMERLIRDPVLLPTV